MIVKLKDGYIRSIEHEKYRCGGCETCDYGSQYTNNITFYFSKFYADFDIIQEYTYLVSLSDIITLFTQNLGEIQNMTEVGFTRWFHRQIRSIVKRKNKGLSSWGISFRLERYLS